MLGTTKESRACQPHLEIQAPARGTCSLRVAPWVSSCVPGAGASRLAHGGRRTGGIGLLRQGSLEGAQPGSEG